MHKLHIIFTACVVWTLFGLGAARADVDVSASLDRDTMSLGQTNTYTLTIRNLSRAPDVEPPRADGLQFRNTPQVYSSTQIINGVRTAEVSLSWNFQAHRKGRYEIPGRSIRIGGEEYTVPPVSVNVTEMPEEMRSRFFLRWELDGGPWFVGQAIPASLQLFLRSDINARLSGMPRTEVNGFTQPTLEGDPRQFREVIDGNRYLVVSWDTVINPVRAGEVNIETQLPLVYDTGRFSRDFFGSRPIQEEIALSTTDANWIIRELPRSDRPESFTGGIGDFELSSRLSTDEVRRGDPVTLTLEIRGRGNFERIQAPEFPENNNWRIYPPRTEFQSDEGSRMEGLLEIEYILTPRTTGAIEIPALTLAWFDPQDQEYRDSHTEPAIIRVQPDPSRVAADAARDPAELELDSEDLAPGLRSLATRIGASGHLTPLWERSVFWTLNGSAAALSLLLTIALYRRKRLDTDPYLSLKSSATRQACDLASQAVKAAEHQQPQEFYTHARQSLRHYLAYLEPESTNPASLTWPEMESILQRFEYPQDQVEHVKQIFDRKDAVQFAGWTPDAQTLQQDVAKFRQLLNFIARRTQ